MKHTLWLGKGRSTKRWAAAFQEVKALSEAENASNKTSQMEYRMMSIWSNVPNRALQRELSKSIENNQKHPSLGVSGGDLEGLSEVGP